MNAIIIIAESVGAALAKRLVQGHLVLISGTWCLLGQGAPTPKCVKCTNRSVVGSLLGTRVTC